MDIPPPIATTVARPHLLRGLIRNKVGLVAAAFLLLLIVLSVIAPLIAPHDPDTASARDILLPPGGAFLLGTDDAGRDVFSRLLFASRYTLAAAALAVVIALVLGVVGGLLAGYYGGWIDSVGNWVTGVLQALPGVVVLLAAAAVVGRSLWISMAIFGILLTPAYFRLTYTAVRAVRSELYIDAARVSGLSDVRIIGRHVLSVVRAPIIIQSAMVSAIAIGIQTGLQFLGVSDLTVPSWGVMLNSGFDSIFTTVLPLLWPSLAVVLTCVALTLLANSLRDQLERTVRPRRKRSAGGMRSVVAPANSETLVTVDNLVVTYDVADGSRDVVRGVTLDVRRGEVHGLIGESGSGKTQTAFAIMGLLSRGGRISAGTITCGSRIGYIPQEPMSNLDPMFTIGSQLDEPMRVVLGLSRREARERTLALLARVGIPDPKRTYAAYPKEISGGMAQRVLIAGAVSCDPDLLIADEPTTALDVTVQAEVLDLLRDLQQERGMGLLLVTHNFGVVADLCDRVSVMRDGQIVESGTVRDIFYEPKHEYTRSLLDAVLEGGPARPELQTGGHP